MIASISHLLAKSSKKAKVSAALYGKSPYGAHLKAVAEGKVRY